MIKKDLICFFNNSIVLLGKECIPLIFKPLLVVLIYLFVYFFSLTFTKHCVPDLKQSSSQTSSQLDMRPVENLVGVYRSPSVIFVWTLANVDFCVDDTRE